MIELGQRLVAAGLNDRGLRGCFGVPCPAHVPRRLAAGLAVPDPMPPAALVPWLFMAGAAVRASDASARLAGDLPILLELGLVRADGDHLVATGALLPAGDGIAACDRADRDDPDAVAFPDDSTYHLLGALPRRAFGRWLDVGTGVGILPLTAGGRAQTVTGTDIDPRALEYARLGAGLSGIDLALRHADLLEGAEAGGPYDLITFNAPIPGARGPLYRRGEPDVLERFWATAPPLLAEGGEILAHALLDDDPVVSLPPGAVAVARYTPAGAEPAFGVIRWSPRPGSRRQRQVELRPGRPHVGRADIDSPGDQG